ncbi:DUF1697 domain-containing protein [Nocardiopsis sp. RSe5-2]|uniref:DUF1697 domain-containing protein n=1 Tax=Nocardiopsis endophytica TaxID=3018445 RepID=A0ABT4UCS9_9ACTN|nr:DUF1697 domain-containing protein [Nocardiopsis endophytica]MDA2814771.1 DUF1697 domain-containing protein [Nocardiopsis endophytica]
MTRYAALLRGVNVGGRRKVPMADLREVLAGLGHTEPATLLQSGNAVFTARAGGGGADALRAELEGALADRFGFPVEALLREESELAAVVDANPLEVGDPSRFLILFADGPVAPADLEGIDAGAYAPEAMAAGEREVYLALPEGLRNAKLPALVERALRGRTVTGRNWRTVVRLLDMLRG